MAFPRGRWSVIWIANGGGDAQGHERGKEYDNMNGDFAEFIETEEDPERLDRLRRAESIGRPIGDDAFIEALEEKTRRPLKPGKRGPKPAPKSGPGQGS